MEIFIRSHVISTCLALAVSLQLYFVPATRPIRSLVSQATVFAVPRFDAWAASRPAHERVAVETLLLEAAGEGTEGMTAVAEVIRNRSTMFKMKIEDVCLKPYQFSGWNDRAEARKFLKNHRDSYVKALQAWRRSASTSLTHGATEYHADYVRPWWAANYSESARIGRHIFYRRES